VEKFRNPDPALHIGFVAQVHTFERDKDNFFGSLPRDNGESLLPTETLRPPDPTGTAMYLATPGLRKGFATTGKNW
jgi:hypothetical protein